MALVSVGWVASWRGWPLTGIGRDHLAQSLAGTGVPGGWAWPELWEAAPGREAHPVTQQTSASRKE